MFEIRYTSAVRPDGQRSSRRRVPLRPSESNRNQKAWMNSLRRRPVSGAVPQRWIDVRLAIPPAASNKIKLSGQQYLCKNTNSKLYRSVLFFFAELGMPIFQLHAGRLVMHARSTRTTESMPMQPRSCFHQQRAWEIGAFLDFMFVLSGLYRTEINFVSGRSPLITSV